MSQQTITVADGKTQSKIYDAVKDGVVGLTPDNMRSIVMYPVSGGVRITFKEPEDTVIDGHTVCNVRGVRVVMKEGSAPTDENDGTVVLENEVIGKYSETPYEVENLTNNKTYYFGFFPYSDHKVFNRSSKNIREIEPKPYILYGFKVDKNDPNPATRITYLEQAVGMRPAHMDFATGVFDYGDWNPDEIFFLRNNKPFMVYSDGTPAYELDANDYTKKKDGTASDVANTAFDGNAMAKMETVWLYQYQDAQYEYCYICSIKLNNDYHAYAHERADGTIQDHIWLAMFEGSLVSNKLRSLKGQAVMHDKTAAQEISYAQANGERWYTRTWSQRNLINMLLHLMFRSDDLQSALGKGYHTGGTSTSPNYLQTGGAFDKGQFYGSTVNRDYVKCFHIENWWGHIWERIAGMINKNGHIFVKMVPSYNQTGDGYTDTALVPAGTSGGYISQANMSQYGRIGFHAAGSETTYLCDGFWYNNGQVDYALVGGRSIDGLHCGPSCLDLDVLASDTSWFVGASLSCEEPPAA